MQSILSTHFRPEASGRLIRLNISLVRLASGLPGLVRASPALFHKMGSFAGVRSATKVRLLGFGFASRKRLDRVFSSFSDGLTAFFRRRRRRHAFSLLVAPNSIHYTSLDSHCAGQVKHSLARFNQTVIILRRNFSKLET